MVAQRFERPTDADPLDIYRVLRATNPSPYMYLLRFDDFDIVGSSPEAHLKVDRTAARCCTRSPAPAGAARPPRRTRALAAELLADPKERAEHVMLVDLGRNDLGRVCRPGTVEVPEFATIERYSHVMHIVSTVVGELRDDRTRRSTRWWRRSRPARCRGAPKVRAMEIIEELEPTRRGIYGGIVGYFGFGGDLDTAIAIRTALLRDGVAYVQAGGGIVADSDPAAEEQETPQQGGRGAGRDRGRRDPEAGPMTAPETPDRDTDRQTDRRPHAGGRAATAERLDPSAGRLPGRRRTRPLRGDPCVVDRPRSARRRCRRCDTADRLLADRLADRGRAGGAGRHRSAARDPRGVRVGLGALLGVVGLILFGGGLDGLRLVDGARFAWPILVMAGGAAVAWSGLQAMRHGPAWPAMGAKYDKPSADVNRPRTEASMWDDLDRGIDPTER